MLGYLHLQKSMGITHLSRNQFKIELSFVDERIRWIQTMMMPWQGHAFRITGSFVCVCVYVCAVGWEWVGDIHPSPMDSPHKWPVTRSFDVSLGVSIHKLLNTSC